MKKLYKLIIIYVILFFFFESIAFSLVFGFDYSLKILFSSPLRLGFNAITTLSAALLASSLVIYLMRDRLLSRFYPYFMLGFYIGNLSIIFMFIIYSFCNNIVPLEFPGFFYIFFAPFLFLLLSYMMFGFAFISLVPALLSAYILFKIVRKNKL